MTIKEALYAHLVGTSGLTAIVAERIYPRVSPQIVTPYISFHFIDTLPVHADGADADVEGKQVQVNCWGDDDDPDLTAIQVKAALRDYSGIMGGDGGVTVQRVFYDGERDLYDERGKTAGSAIDFIIWYET